MISHQAPQVSSLHEAGNTRLRVNLYGQRSQNEVVNSRIKRKYGVFVRAYGVERRTSRESHDCSSLEERSSRRHGSDVSRFSDGPSNVGVIRVHLCWNPPKDRCIGYFTANSVWV